MRLYTELLLFNKPPRHRNPENLKFLEFQRLFVSQPFGRSVFLRASTCQFFFPSRSTTSNIQPAQAMRSPRWAGARFGNNRPARCYSAHGPSSGNSRISRRALSSGTTRPSSNQLPSSRCTAQASRGVPGCNSPVMASSRSRGVIRPYHAVFIHHEHHASRTLAKLLQQLHATQVSGQRLRAHMAPPAKGSWGPAPAGAPH